MVLFDSKRIKGENTSIKMDLILGPQKYERSPDGFFNSNQLILDPLMLLLFLIPLICLFDNNLPFFALLLTFSAHPSVSVLFNF